MKIDKERLVVVVLPLCGLVLLAYILGAASIKFHLPGSGWLRDGFEAVKAQLDSIEEEKRYKKIEARAGSGVDPVSRAKLLRYDPKLAEPGYTLITIRSRKEVSLVDMQGNIVHVWNSYQHNKSALSDEDSKVYNIAAEVMPNGDLIVLNHMRSVTPYGRGMNMMDKNSNLVWRADTNKHHDFWLDYTRKKIYALGSDFVSTHRNLMPQQPKQILNDYIEILDWNGKLEHRFSLFEAFAGTSFEPMLFTKPADRDSWDLFHVNSIQVLDENMAPHFPMFKVGQILISSRNMSAIFIFDPETRKIVWARSGPFKAQHHARFLENGNIILFDNEGHNDGERRYSRAIEYNPVTGGVDWSFAGSRKFPMYSDTHGSVQRLMNGNTLITEANESRLIEVTSDGVVVWEYQLPGLRIGDTSPNTINSAVRYRPDQVPFVQEQLNERPSIKPARKAKPN